MNEFINSIIGGSIPALGMIIVYFLTTERRLTRIETDISWLKRETHGCQPNSETDTK